MYQLKICGITRADDALLAAEAGADAIGLNFYEKSPRYIHAEQAAEIVERLRQDYSADQVQIFGVFVNASLDDILGTIREANLYGPDTGFGIQLHGDEPPELLRDLHQHGLGRTGELLQATGHIPTVPLVRAFRCQNTNLAQHTAPVVTRSPDRVTASNRVDLSQHASYLQACQQLGALPQAVLLDAYAPGSYGGTGHVLDWTTIPTTRPALLNLPIVLAGGLTPANVAAAITTARPDAIDVASGVESSPGIKDAAKIYAFAAAAKKSFAAVKR